MMRSVLVAALPILASSCHLADDVEPPKCGPGTHVENRHCVDDPIDGLAITITPAAGGTLCTGDPSAQRPPTIDPASLTVARGAEFRFLNNDTVDHDVRGVDGQAWVTVKAKGPSVFTSIAKAGSWDYRISGCAKGGTIVVQ